MRRWGSGWAGLRCEVGGWRIKRVASLRRVGQLRGFLGFAFAQGRDDN